MKRELNLEEEHIAEKIFRELCGLTFESAEAILKFVAAEIKNHAVIDDKH